MAFAAYTSTQRRYAPKDIERLTRLERLSQITEEPASVWLKNRFDSDYEQTREIWLKAVNIVIEKSEEVVDEFLNGVHDVIFDPSGDLRNPGTGDA